MTAFPLLEDAPEDETLTLPFKVKGAQLDVVLYPAAAADLPAIDALFQYYAVPGLESAIKVASYPSEAARKKAALELVKLKAKRTAKLEKYGIDLSSTEEVWALLLGPAHQQMLEGKASAAQVRRAGIVALTWHATGSTELAMAAWSGKARTTGTSGAAGSTPSGKTGDEEISTP